MVCFVNNDNIGQLGYPLESLWEGPFPVQIGVAEYSQVAEVCCTASDVRQPLPQVGLPYALFRGFGREQHDPLAPRGGSDAR